MTSLWVRCIGSGTAPREVKEAAGRKLVGLCRECGNWVYVRTSGMVKEHRTAAEREAA